MFRLFFLILASLLALPVRLFADVPPSEPLPIGFNGAYPEGTIVVSGFTLVSVLTFIQAFLLKVVLPIVVVGSAFYIAYELFTAQGDETKMKKAWKSIAYAAVGIVVIGASYAFVTLASHLSL